MKYLVLLGRILFSAIFISSGLFHFTAAAVGYAQSSGVPFADFLVPASGVLAIVGALSIVIGYKAKWGAWALIAFLIPVTLMMHNFWVIEDAMASQMQQIMFMKNLSMLGGAIIIAFFGAGPLSIDGCCCKDCCCEKEKECCDNKEEA